MYRSMFMAALAMGAALPTLADDAGVVLVL